MCPYHHHSQRFIFIGRASRTQDNTDCLEPVLFSFERATYCCRHVPDNSGRSKTSRRRTSQRKKKILLLTNTSSRQRPLLGLWSTSGMIHLQNTGAHSISDYINSSILTALIKLMSFLRKGLMDEAELDCINMGGADVKWQWTSI